MAWYFGFHVYWVTPEQLFEPRSQNLKLWPCNRLWHERFWSNQGFLTLPILQKVCTLRANKAVRIDWHSKTWPWLTVRVRDEVVQNLARRFETKGPISRVSGVRHELETVQPRWIIHGSPLPRALRCDPPASCPELERSAWWNNAIELQRKRLVQRNA